MSLVPLQSVNGIPERVSLTIQGGVRDTCPPWSNFFHFHAIWTKMLLNNRFSSQTQGLAPIWKILHPPLGMFSRQKVCITPSIVSHTGYVRRYASVSVAFHHPDNLCIVHVCDGGFSSHPSIVGSVVECSPATRAARVRFPDDAKSIFEHFSNE